MNNFVAGDRVKLVGDQYLNLDNRLATVTAVGSDGAFIYVEMDERPHYWKDLKSIVFYANELELCNEVAYIVACESSILAVFKSYDSAIEYVSDKLIECRGSQSGEYELKLVDIANDTVQVRAVYGRTGTLMDEILVIKRLPVFG